MALTREDAEKVAALVAGLVDMAYHRGATLGTVIWDLKASFPEYVWIDHEDYAELAPEERTANMVVITPAWMMPDDNGEEEE